MDKRLARAVPVFIALTAFGISEQSFAAGFQLFEQSPSGQGDAFAGAAAVAEDSSTIFYNPAGMTYLNGYQSQAALQVIMPSFTFQPSNATTAGGAPLTGMQNSDGGETAFVPNFYAMAPLDDRTRVGIGVESPFGLSTRYDPGWIGRYYALETNLKTINVNPSVAYKATDWLSLGVGFDLMYSDVFLSNAVDFGGILGGAAQSNDGSLKLQANTLGYGWNAGVMLQPLEHTRLGLSYRSLVHLGFDGQAKWTVPSAFQPTAAALGKFQSGGAHANINLPETASLALAQDLTSKWTLLSDVTWTRWSRFRTLAVTFDNPGDGTSATPENWHDTFRESLGVVYRSTDNAKLRLGVAYDPTPTKSSTRTLRIPDADRFWLSVGYNLRLFEKVSMDFAYSHLFALTNSSVNLSSATQGNVSGTYDAEVNIFALGFKYEF